MQPSGGAFSGYVGPAPEGTRKTLEEIGAFLDCSGDHSRFPVACVHARKLMAGQGLTGVPCDTWYGFRESVRETR
ncbi:uncharacterized protein G2W53_009128 [Senna tora]|uniref:Uncharacterized protein n=1 Tax=Senna tora TaxID=362788 RepID=A0A835C7K4_9FABA|nr:uncharacterized protein G2W53_009128 [Senna tora]